MKWDKALIRLLLLIIKEHCKSVSLGIRGMSIYIPWITGALKEISIKSLLLLLLIAGPVAELIVCGIIFFYFIAFLL